LTIVRASLNLNNPNEIKDPVFALLGNAAAAEGLGKLTVRIIYVNDVGLASELTHLNRMPTACSKPLPIKLSPTRKLPMIRRAWLLR